MYFAIFELIKFKCFGSTLSYPHKKFLNPHPPRTRTQSSAGSCTRLANPGTRNSRGTLISVRLCTSSRVNGITNCEWARCLPI